MPGLPTSGAVAANSGRHHRCVGTHPLGSTEDLRQPVHLDDDVLVDALDASRTDEAHHAKGAAARPPSPMSCEPRRLVVPAGEVTLVVGPGLGLDRDRWPGWGDRHRVDVAPGPPRQRVPKPPPVHPESGDRALHLVLRACPDPAPTNERKPVASVHAQPDGREEREASERRRPPRSRPRARGWRPQRLPTPPLRRERAGDTADVAHSSRTDLLELAAGEKRALTLGRLCHCSIVPLAPDGPPKVRYRAELRRFAARLRRIGPRMDQEKRKKPRI